MRLKIFTDGGARGNPGPAAVGVVVKDQNEEIITQFGKTIGLATNNSAEYQAIIEALGWVKKSIPKEEIEGVEFFLDSQLIASQLSGIFKVKKGNLRELLFKIRELEQEIGGNVFYQTIPREENKLADRLVNQVLDQFK